MNDPSRAGIGEFPCVSGQGRPGACYIALPVNWRLAEIAVRATDGVKLSQPRAAPSSRITT